MPARPPLIGKYSPPAVKRGERVACLYRDTDCKVTSWTDAPIPWPRVQPLGQRGGCGLWVNDTLARAIRTESAAALRYWFGVTVGVVWKWRKAMGVRGPAGTPGSKEAIRKAAKKGAAAIKAKDWTDEELDAKAALARRLGLRPGPRWTPTTGGWTAAQVAVLGTADDAVIAKRIGKTPGAVRCKRQHLKIPKFRDRRRRG